MNDKQKWYVFQKDLGLPIYVRCDVGEFHPSLVAFLSSMRFTELSGREAEEAAERVGAEREARVLDLRPCGAAVAQQIRSAAESDAHGPESIVPGDGYRVYRHKDVAILLYSFGSKEWVAGAFRDFGTGEAGPAYKAVANRFLGWSLAPLGVVGFWGRWSDEGVVVTRQRDSGGEAVFIDVRRDRAIVPSGAPEAIRPDSRVVRLDPTAGPGRRRMGAEQLAGFLAQHTCYLDYSGPSVPVRQAIRAIAQRLEGVVRAPAAPGSRPDLSL